jgi:hypothetical protein
VPPHHPQVFKSEDEEYAEAVAKRKLGDAESSQSQEKDGEPVKSLVSQETPFFHFDLASAVAAAEATAASYPTQSAEY